MFTIKKQFTFSAAHHLNGLPATHQCARVHGHNYVVEIELASQRLNAVGFVVDYGALDDFRAILDDVCEHRDLNESLAPWLGSLQQPSAENLAQLFYEWAIQMWPQVVAVSVSETPKTWARFSDSLKPGEAIAGIGLTYAPELRPLPKGKQ